MKKLFLVLAILVFATLSLAQTWHTANQATIGWTAVAPIQPTDAITYQVYARQDLVSDGVALGGPVSNTQATVTMPSEGNWWLGVETLRLVEGQNEPLRSAGKAWSHDPEACGPTGPFGVRYFLLPGAASGLRLQ